MGLLRVAVVGGTEAQRAGVSASINSYPDLHILGGWEKGKGMEEVRHFHPDVVIYWLDDSQADPDRIQALKSACPFTSVIALVDLSKVTIETVLATPLDGCLRVGTAPRHLHQTIDLVANGGITCLPRYRQGVAGVAKESEPKVAAPSPEDNLTPREKDVYKLLATGASNKAIAEKLFISEATAKTHIRNILHKLGAASRLDAVLLGLGRSHPEEYN